MIMSTFCRTSGLPSNVTEPKRVPATVFTTTDTARVEVRDGVAVHSTAVVDTQDDDKQWSAPTTPVGEPESMPKLTPTTDSTVPPETAKLVPANVTTGAAGRKAKERSEN